MRNRTLRVGRLGVFVVLTGAALVLVLQPQLSGQAAGSKGAAAMPGPADEFARLGFKFEGAATCSNAQCHGADEPKEGAGATTLAEFTQWSGGDLHKTAHEILANEESAAIAEKMKIADATTDARCTACHAMNVPEKLRGREFDLAEGVTCNACHGPSEKWNAPHKEKGWTDKQRAALKTHDALLKKLGLYDTKSPLARADMCTSCHLAIDADMVAAGHPQPVFELDIFSRSEQKGGYYVSQHWREPNVPFYGASLWSTGQVVAVRDAMRQLADRAGKKVSPKEFTTAYMQAMAHYSAFKPVMTAGVVKGDAAAWDKAAAQINAGVKAKKMADVAAGAKTIADGAAKLAPAVGAAKWDKAKTLAVLKALLADSNTAKLYGSQGMEQQAFAIYALWNAYDPKGAKVAELITQNLFPPDEGELTAAQFTTGLKTVAAQVK
jgi:hypothetical protein